MNERRIAWLVPNTWFYWQPSLYELTNLFSDVKVFTGSFPGFAQGLDNILDIEIVGKRRIIPINQSPSSYGNNFTYLSPKIIPRLLSYKPDVVFSSSFGIWTIFAIIFKFIGRWKIVLAYEGSSPGVDYRNSALRLALRRLMIRFVDACITNSQVGKEYLINHLSASPNRVFAHPYEVPDKRSLAAIDENLTVIGRDSNLKFSDLKHPIFLYVGSVIPRKGVQFLLEACKYLKTSGVNSFHVLIVGDGAQRLELQKLSCEYQLEDCITWIGRIDYKIVSTYFYHADVFVLPTLEDTWGMVVLEAMLLGKPILCSRGAGASELILEGENGYCFEPDSYEELALAMYKVIESPEHIEFMGQRSHEIMRQYTPQRAAEFMAKVVTLVTRS